jgi:uncharacterized protein
VRRRCRLVGAQADDPAERALSVPAGPGRRIVALDGLRGVAVIGILLMNVAAFAMPFAAYDNPAAYGPVRWPDVLVWGIEFVAIDGKFRAIFSALFGASLVLVTERAEAAGRSPARAHYARMLTLLLFGLAHACLIWSGDILVLYALIGMVAYPARHLPIERLLALATMLLLAQGIILGISDYDLAMLQHAAGQPGASSATIALWRSVVDGIGSPSPATLTHDLALHRGRWWPLVQSMSAAEPGSIRMQLLMDGPETLGLMLLGMAGFRSGFLSGAWDPVDYRRTARRALAIGLPPTITAAVLVVWLRFPPLLTATIAELAMLPCHWLLAISFAALIIPWIGSECSLLRTRIVAAGRMAFSNYLGSSILMTMIFYGWGLGLYGHVERWRLLGFVILAWVLMLAWSKAWLARFRFGPLEYVWRSLTRGRLLTLRQAIAS